MMSLTCWSISLVLLVTYSNATPTCQTVKEEVHPIKLPNCGPEPAPLPVINEPPVEHPTVEHPMVKLPAVVPPSQTVRHTAHCTKTILKPQVYHQIIIVPYLQKYLRTCYKPVLETINYQTHLPLCTEILPSPTCTCGCGQPICTCGCSS